MKRYRIGDKIRCLPGFNNDSNYQNGFSGGAGYKEGETFTIRSIDENSNNTVLWCKELNGKGVFDQAVTLLLDEPNYEIY